MTKIILLVEDNPDDEELALRTLRKCLVHTVTVAHDGAKALDFLFCTGDYAERDPGVNPTLILLDLKLPKIHGLEVLRRTKENPRTRHIPIIIFTSSSEENDIKNAYNLGANSYICKPVDYQRYCDALKHIILYWLDMSQLPTKFIP